ncbi:seryl-tRNA synthetase [Mycoplasma testudineum]|uniref:Serine--tRNA ligase n=1 Tax=Mycoplasma testudineum TaxID=244584 RepID=A0A4R6IAZ6_9MOLU|nr:serine--tRNA ligase [Mycoplasma testudineum]OYD26482.1 serine--tRNA ligase [Mycoplasma testudineum]TDO18954.1 seryl-tRNA synthetase [Mycoplasma testudineum]
MLDIKKIIQNPEYFIKKLETKNVEASTINNLVRLSQKRGSAIHKAEKLKFLLNNESDLIKAISDKNEKAKAIEKLQTIKAEQKYLQEEANRLDKELEEIIIRIPNVQLDIVPVGKDENDNVVVYRQAAENRLLKTLDVSHYEIAEKFDIIDFKRAIRMSGTRFILYKGEGAKLVRALQNYMLDFHEKNGYEEYIVPVMVNPEMLFGTGQLPKFEEDLFKLNSNHYLIPTSEVSLTNIYNNEIIDLTKSKKLTAYSDCFRSEIGSGGKDNHGIIRMHQFRKVEMVKITSQELAEVEFNSMVENAKAMLLELEIPFQQLLLSTGDTGFSSQITYDFEIWLPSEKRFRETSSVSWMGDFQARRANIRYRNNEGKTEFAHTMNGSGMAIDRIMAVLIEQGYDAEKNIITIPKILVPYFGKDSIKLQD